MKEKVQAVLKEEIATLREQEKKKGAYPLSI